ncbi:MAG: transcriptional regulator [Flavobacteriales bacterium]|jgi:DNA-binding transcriptional ArsR family regulator|nr:transcriptional regulator [Flavobacteriales bacterium]MBK9513808.1 transcriptional regulator [Flavobacteriales bacterium]MBP7449957.1 transcriptional regulator [Flavobacteriales bacterium]HOY27846.1 transcriptional regulator [Flavobacteriales bacterium]
MGFAPLDPVLHNQLRLAVVSLLIAVDEADFTYLLERTGATRGNLSVQLTKLKEAGYLEITKGYKDNYPNTRCRLTKAGIKAFERYVKAIKGYLQ